LLSRYLRRREVEAQPVGLHEMGKEGSRLDAAAHSRVCSDVPMQLQDTGHCWRRRGLQRGVEGILIVQRSPAEPTAEADRGRHPGFPSFGVSQAAPAAELGVRLQESAWLPKAAANLSIVG